MSRSRKMTGKKTVKQVDARVSELSTQQDAVINKLDTLGMEFAGFAQAAANDILKLNHLIYAMLDKEGLITKITCVNCKKEVIRPELDGVEQSEDCPHCGQNLHNSTQVSLSEVDLLEEEE